jgi:hypothetical protein
MAGLRRQLGFWEGVALSVGISQYPTAVRGAGRRFRGESAKPPEAVGTPLV